MKGLIYKDLANLRKYIRQLLIIFGLFAVLFGIMQGNTFFVSAYGLMVSMMIVLSSVSYDERAHWDGYALTLPLEVKTLVGSKYLLGLLAAAAGAVFALLLGGVGTLFFPASFGESALATGVCFCVALIMIAVLLPLIYKFGTEKSRYLMMVIFLGPTLAIIIANQLGAKMPDESALGIVLIALPFAAAALYAGSYFLAVNICGKKEY